MLLPACTSGAKKQHACAETENNSSLSWNVGRSPLGAHPLSKCALRLQHGLQQRFLLHDLRHAPADVLHTSIGLQIYKAQQSNASLIGRISCKLMLRCRNQAISHCLALTTLNWQDLQHAGITICSLFTLCYWSNSIG